MQRDCLQCGKHLLHHLPEFCGLRCQEAFRSRRMVLGSSSCIDCGKYPWETKFNYPESSRCAACVAALEIPVDQEPPCHPPPDKSPEEKMSERRDDLLGRCFS